MSFEVRSSNIPIVVSNHFPPQPHGPLQEGGGLAGWASRLKLYNGEMDMGEVATEGALRVQPLPSPCRHPQS